MKLALFALTSLLPIAALAQTPASMTSADGTIITIFYEISAEPGYSAIAQDMKISIRGQKLVGASAVRAVLLNYYDFSSGCVANRELESTKQIDLPCFSGQGLCEATVPGWFTIRETGRGYSCSYRQEIAVVIDDEWLSVDSSRPWDHNFKFKF
jgi:hypothetical protein